MEINEQTEQLTEYKILTRKFMHEINWSLYYIPKTHNEKVKHLTDEELMNIKKSKALVNNLYIKMNTDKNYEDKNKENENNSNNILFIPQHNSMNNAIYPKEKTRKIENF